MAGRLMAEVTWGRTPSVAEEDAGQYFRHMQRVLSRQAAAELAADIVFVLFGPGESNASSEKFYLVSRERPRVEYRDSVRQFSIEVKLVGA